MAYTKNETKLKIFLQKVENEKNVKSDKRAIGRNSNGAPTNKQLRDRGFIRPCGKWGGYISVDVYCY